MVACAAKASAVPVRGAVPVGEAHNPVLTRPMISVRGQDALTPMRGKSTLEKASISFRCNGLTEFAAASRAEFVQNSAWRRAGVCSILQKCRVDVSFP